MCKRGDIYYVDFGQNIDSNKQCGIRPAVIVSNNRANEHSPVITVVPLTSRTYKKRSLPTHVFIPKGCGLERNSLALAEQVEAIDKKESTRKAWADYRCGDYGAYHPGNPDTNRCG